MAVCYFWNYLHMYISFLNVFQLCVLHRGIESLLMSYIVANLVGFFTIIVLEKRIRVNVISRFDFGIFRELLTFSVPLIPNYLSWWIVDSSDRYIVLWVLGVSANGVLAIAHKFPTVLQSIFGLFLNSWQDMAIAGETDEKDFLRLCSKRCTDCHLCFYGFSFLRQKYSFG